MNRTVSFGDGPDNRITSGAAFIGSSPALAKVYRNIQAASQHQFPVLISGESGTGKELIARIIHDLSPRISRPFVPADCGAMSPTLIESELFGYVKGAFTGADGRRIGLLQAANGGTVFLDEVGELALHCQTKLLRVLQEHDIRPIGSTETIQLDIRVIAATNRKLEVETKAGRFRQDLYFRLNVLQINVPPLRERKGDIPTLANAFISKHQELQPSIRSFSDEAMRFLMSYDWPGNVRELEHAIEHALALGEGPVIGASDLPESITTPSDPSNRTNSQCTLAELERRAIFGALRITQGDKLKAARLLNMGKTTLYRKLKEFLAQTGDQPAPERSNQ